MPSKGGGGPQIALESPKPPVGGVGRKRVQVRVEKWSRGIPRAPDFFGGAPDRTCLVRNGFSDLELVLEILAIYNLVERP
jgi:hypothetical protein